MFPCFDLVGQRQWATNAKNMVLVVQYFLTRLLLFHHMGNVSCISKGMTDKSKIENTRVVHWATIYAKPTLDHWVLSSLSFCLFSKLIIINHKWRIYVNVYAFQSSHSSTFFCRSEFIIGMRYFRYEILYFEKFRTEHLHFVESLRHKLDIAAHTKKAQQSLYTYIEGVENTRSAGVGEVGGIGLSSRQFP